MNIKQGLQKSIKGGYDESKRLTALGVMKSTHEMLLDIEFWKCLGNEERWGLMEEWTMRSVKTREEFGDMDEWHVKMHIFIAHLADLKDIETAFDLATK